MATRIGIDTGGTFTDLVAFDETVGGLTTAKVPSSPNNHIRALRAVLSATQISPGQNNSVVLGTTIAINTVLERKGARVAFITTKGFEDILLIQRADRPDNYNLHWRKPLPLVKRRYCLGVQERVNSRGEVIEPLTEREMGSVSFKLADLIRHEGIEAIAVCLLFSFKNPVHELKLSRFLATHFPSLPLSVSSEVAPIWREYERANTTATDAYVKPAIARYVDEATLSFDEAGIGKSRWLMKSNGGMSSLRMASHTPVQMLVSGLVGGLVAGRYWGELTGTKKIITFDMGGTSCDIGIINDGQITHTTDFEVEWGMPVATPAAHVSSVGAGGGSIAWVDKGEFLQVGPQSAGAEPGPVCYGKGGSDITVTDADLVLGRLNPAYFLGGKLALDKGLAARKMNDLASRLSMDADTVASSIVQIVNNNMAEAIKLITVSKGIDPREYTLLAFGGAGPLHACELAREALIPKVIVPIYPGEFSALGTILADTRIDRMVTLAEKSDAIGIHDINRQVQQIERQIREELLQEGYAGEVDVFRFLSLRYLEQNFEQDIPLALGELSQEDMAQAYSLFHQSHKDHYGYCMPETPLEIVHLKIVAVGRLEKPVFPQIPDKPEPQGTRRDVFLPGKGWILCPVFRRETLGAGFVIEGPVVVEEAASTVLVPPDYVLNVDKLGALVLQDVAKR